VRADDDRVWTRLLELVEDPDPLVRGDVIHALTDSTPAPRVPAVIQALDSRRNDPDERIRRRVRKTLAHYRRTGKVTDAAR
jgi:HEAT repeat protein